MKYSYDSLFKNMIDAGINPIGSVYSSINNIYRLDYQSQLELKSALIAENFRFHYEKNTFYRAACESQEITPEDIQGVDDLLKIPLIPIQRFKETNSHILMSTGLENIEFEMRSTGTSGVPSVSRRDAQTVTLGIHAINSMYREFFEIVKGAILFLMPSTEEIPEMGMIKVLNMLSGLTDANRCLVKRTYFNPEDAIKLLREWENKHTRYIVGPPFIVYKFIDFLKQNNIRLSLDKDTKIINLGGWKRFAGMEIPRGQYNKDCAEYLGINPNQVRDMYGLVEANNLAIECNHQNKHVPPWVHYSVRDPKDISKEVPNGQRGVLAIIDPISMSYPTFILTEDLVYLNKETECDCGRNGQTMVYLSRIKGAEIGCCAINLEKQMEQNVDVQKAAQCVIAQ